jgi:hypothetical protein
MQRKVTGFHAVNVGASWCKRDALPTELTARSISYAALADFPNSFPNRSARSLYRAPGGPAIRAAKNCPNFEKNQREISKLDTKGRF